MKRFIILTSFILLWGCSNGIYIKVPDEIATSTHETGYLAGSLGVTTEWPSTGEGIITTLSIRPLGRAQTISLTNTQTKTDFESATDKGQIFVAELPVGRYEINQVQFKGTNGRQTVRSKSNQDLAIYFDITEHQVTYIGQFMTSSLVANSQLWNTPYPTGLGLIRHSYQAERDRALMAERFPEIKVYSFYEANLDGYEANKLASKVLEQ
ncbi:hypothetical protein C9J03_07335 [Photobacterium gaetbulicola]|uniref:Uncharacterized protein n=1 Tax=Photobacterium gaetbulicola Gung47 TaxID=658445 RepID=A0A0C5WFK4_9GAMM|nr:hypothetical protein [Photobacterium gaetbulicola]AJR05918.1 hypothetical protein H744_1c0893 [Photobacterium gaetbulicola Gung47]PSU13269.1 hypothetical protein C9J03_07335 [Photobacterium gaetbulicola]